MKETSKEAYLSVRNVIPNHHSIIIKTLYLLGKASTFAIAEKSGLEYHQVARRMAELERKETVEICGKIIDKDGHKRHLYQIKK